MNQFSETYHEQLNEAEKMIQLHEEESNSKDQFSKLTKIEIIELAETLIQTADIKAAYSNLLELKEAFEKISVAEKPIQIKEWIDAGNEMKDFVPHQDELKSIYTVMAYLNDVPDGQGGTTRFFSEIEPGSPPIYVKPKKGSVVIFNHNIAHDGERLTGNEKYIMRSDIMIKI